MSMKCRRFIPRTLVVLGMMFGLFLVTPPAYAGGAVIIVPAEQSVVPEGSQIPQVRAEETEEEVRDYKEKMRQRQTAPAQQQQQLPKDELPKP